MYVSAPTLHFNRLSFSWVEYVLYDVKGTNETFEELLSLLLLEAKVSNLNKK